MAVAPDPVFRIWRNRLRIEIEAAHVFAQLAQEISRLRGERDPVAQLARTAATDELQHAEYCKKILGHAPRPYTFPTISRVEFGPPGLSCENKILYTCVAVGCVTETLSTALLVEMQKCAAPGLIRQTVHQILTDEVQHSRLGWAELARAANGGDTGWLSAFIPAMIRDALNGDVGPMLSKSEAEVDLSAWGILSPVQAQGIMNETLHQLIGPGLESYGVRFA